MNDLSEKRLADRLMDAYLSWREACLRVSDAYGYWKRDTELDATIACAVYMAALDQEERAAAEYAALIRRTGHHVVSNTTVPRSRLREAAT